MSNTTIPFATPRLPLAGLGTYKLEPRALRLGLARGFCLVDTAKMYGNEEIVGEEIALCPHKVEVITKLDRPHLENPKILEEGIRDSVRKLRCVPAYVLLHAPYPDVPMVALLQTLEVWRQRGDIQQWGVSNFSEEQLLFLKQEGLHPALNQAEYHPFFQQSRLLEYCQKEGILFQAYRPLARGKALEHSVVLSLAQRYACSPATVIYSWLATGGMALVSRVSCQAHMDAYAASGNIRLTEEERVVMASLHQHEEKGRSCTQGGWCIPFSAEIQSAWKARVSK